MGLNLHVSKVRVKIKSCRYVGRPDVVVVVLCLQVEGISANTTCFCITDDISFKLNHI